MANQIVVGCWDCAYCGADRISGEIKICPHCGKPRGSDVQFYMAGPKEYVKDPEQIEKEPDWLCSFCDTLNSASSEVCSSCGASRKDSELNYFENQEKKRREKEEEARRKAASAVSAQAGAKRSGSTLGRNLLLAAAVIAVFLLASSLMPRTKKMHVDARTWERTLTIESMNEVQESGWTLPGGEWDVTSRQEVYGYDHVLDHYEWRTRQVAEQVLDGYDTYYTYEDLGNGYFEEVPHQSPRYRTEYRTETYQVPVYVDLPIYRTKYYYRIMRWQYDHEETASGRDSEPYYPDVRLPSSQRIASRTERYWIVSGQQVFSVSFELWQQIETGSNIIVKTRDGRIEELER